MVIIELHNVFHFKQVALLCQFIANNLSFFLFQHFNLFFILAAKDEWTINLDLFANSKGDWDHFWTLAKEYSDDKINHIASKTYIDIDLLSL